MLHGLTADGRRIYLVAMLAASDPLGETLGLSEGESVELRLNVADRALAAAGTVGFEAVARLLMALCESPQGVTVNARRLAGFVREVEPALVENDLHELWLELTVVFCLAFVNIHNTAVSTAEERAELLTKCMRSELLDRCGRELRALAIYCICETLSSLGHWGAALEAYDWLDEALQLAPEISPSLAAVFRANQARTACVVAALAGDAERAALELTLIRAELRQPPYEPDRLDSLASDLTTAAIVMQRAPGEQSAAIAIEIVEECLALPQQELASLSGAAYVSFIRLASYVAAHGAVEAAHIEEAVRPSAARVREEASAGDSGLAKLLREADLRLASLRRDTHALVAGFRAIVAHQDVSRLSACTYMDLVTTSPVANALLDAIDVLVDQGHLRAAAELLDELPSRTLRLAVAAEFAPYKQQRSAGARLAAEAARSKTSDARAAEPETCLEHQAEWHDFGAADEAILWEEPVWASLLGDPHRGLVEGEGSRSIMRAWLSDRARLRLLITTPQGVLHVDSARDDVAALPRPDQWDPALIRDWVQSGSVSRGAPDGTDDVRGTLASQLQLALSGVGADSRRVSIIDFTGTAYAIPMLREVLLAPATKGTDPDVTATPSARRAGRRTVSPVGERAAIHIGDWSGTLVGPWLEAAYARSLSRCDIRCGFPSGDLPPVGDAPELLIVSAHGALASERPDHLGEIRFGTRSLGMEEASSATFLAPRVALLGACEVGRGHTHADELHGASLPSMLLHRGVELVVAPVSPVDDLSSAVLVTRTLFYFDSQAAEAAVSAALAEIRGWSARDVGQWVASLVEGFVTSTLADHAPWPRHVVRAHCDEWLGRLEGGGIASHLRSYVATTW